MKNSRPSAGNRGHLKGCKYSTPEQKLDWLAAAVRFAQECQKIRKAAKGHTM